MLFVTAFSEPHWFPFSALEQLVSNYQFLFDLLISYVINRLYLSVTFEPLGAERPVGCSIIALVLKLYCQPKLCRSIGIVIKLNSQNVHALLPDVFRQADGASLELLLLR